MTYVRPTHEDGIAAAEAIATEHAIALVDLRSYAADRLSEHWPEDEGMGSSDVSCHLSSLGNYEPEALRIEAARLRDRDALVARVAARTGKDADTTLRLLQQMFAPIED